MRNDFGLKNAYTPDGNGDKGKAKNPYVKGAAIPGAGAFKQHSRQAQKISGVNVYGKVVADPRNRADHEQGRILNKGK